MAPSVDILPEPVERPLSRHLLKKDKYFNRVVPDWELQHKTLEQQYLYEGDFSVAVKELTDEGAVVQDLTTGVFGFVPKEDFGFLGTKMIPGDTIHGARCTFMDTTVVESPSVGILRLQTGIVYEWNEALGEGYIIPTEGQDAKEMVRVLRRDIRWHDSRRLFPGQFLQYEVALPEEVPIEYREEDKRCYFALRVRNIEVRFSLEESFDLLPEGSIAEDAKPALAPSFEDRKLLADPDATRAKLVEERQAHQLDIQRPLSFRAPNFIKQYKAIEQTWQEPETEVEEDALAYVAERDAYPVTPMRAGLEKERQPKRHPILQRFAEEAPMVAEAESPVWLWEPDLAYLKEESYDPIVPIQLEKPEVAVKPTRILAHEVGAERGARELEEKYHFYSRDMKELYGPGRREVEEKSVQREWENRRTSEALRRFWKRKEKSSRVRETRPTPSESS